MSKKGWDLGGLECPYDVENLTVVDYVPPEQAEKELGRILNSYRAGKVMDDYVHRDLRVTPWKLPPREEVHAGKVLCGLCEDVGGWNDSIDTDSWLHYPSYGRMLAGTLPGFLDELDKCLLPGGVLNVRELAIVCDLMRQYPLFARYEEIDCEPQGYETRPLYMDDVFLKLRKPE
jgi:hypothetical protein